jgi:hypothetical protein
MSDTGRIIMTELRDDAAWDYLKALNTGSRVLCQAANLRAMPKGSVPAEGEMTP